MRPLAHFVMPWLVAPALLAGTSPAAAQVAEGGHIGITIGTPGPIAQPYPTPRRGYPYPVDPGWTSPGPRGWAFEAGFDDGYREGVKDGRRGRRYDPFGRKDFRRAIRGYHREYGPKSFYQDQYRHGFRRGYERGYREALPGSRRYRPWGAHR
jgi:hypothetical protein